MPSVWVTGKEGHRQQAGKIQLLSRLSSQEYLLPHWPPLRGSSASSAHADALSPISVLKPCSHNERPPPHRIASEWPRSVRAWPDEYARAWRCSGCCCRHKRAANNPACNFQTAAEPPSPSRESHLQIYLNLQSRDSLSTACE